MTLTMVLMLWLASSYLEYKIVSRVPMMKRVFTGIPGILISIGISFAIASMLGLQGGVVAGMAAILGLATNEITFGMFSSAARHKEQLDTKIASARQYKTDHPRLFTDVRDGVYAGVKTCIAICIAALYIMGIPTRVCRRVRRGATNLKARVI